MAKPAGLGVGVLDKAAAEPLALSRRQDRGAVKDNTVISVLQDPRAARPAAFLDDICAMVPDHLLVVLEHRPRQTANASNVTLIRGLHARGDGGRIGSWTGNGGSHVHWPSRIASSPGAP